ncbi:IS30 family transposase [Paucibacter sp. APW11]|uniref:IS30 family transposase n=1 Tax=Roseateles aquae TaxID=3077235 RepID=A0ABU3PIX6_9BURK|nr:IS30 family transposase [Paucibacter sp. APW11]MDT9002492.1 IS30 family transposase [Paucibacter sp. APW11]
MEYRQLTQDERYVMAYMLRQGNSLRRIALALDRSASTISRERQRNMTRHDGAYRAERAHQYAIARRRRTRKKSQYSEREWREVARQLQRKWSPAQIAGRRRHLGRPSMSKETIYRHIRRERRAGGQLWRHLRIVSKFGRKRRGSPATRGRLIGKRHISERPKCVEQRRQQGHWEGDTVMGADLRHCVLTLVERATGYLVIKKLSARNKEQAAAAMARSIIGLRGRFKTITLDNGTEFHDYEHVEKHFKVKFYFATPYHSWERGTNENTNGLIRQYLPKGMCFKNLTQNDCDHIAAELNDRPRERLGFRTPREAFSRY